MQIMKHRCVICLCVSSIYLLHAIFFIGLNSKNYYELIFAVLIEHYKQTMRLSTFVLLAIL